MPLRGKRVMGPRGYEVPEASFRHGGGVLDARGMPRLTAGDAVTFLKYLKERFNNDRDKYNAFTDLMKDFKAQRVDMAGVIMHVKELFQGHEDLILMFNAYLPYNKQIVVGDVTHGMP